ncbi:MAG: DUF4129 domain-containing protein [Bacteroidetes bacterium]|nr:MAG: DUF4129 domain-containing protein [Bacteroidota bacterium]
MKLIRLNNYLLFVKIFILIASLSICCCVAAQNTSVDTSSVDTVKTTTDTTIPEEVPNYFDNKGGNGSSDTIELSHVPSYVMDSLRNDDAFWYANTRFKKKMAKENANSSTPPWVKTLTWILIVGVFFAALIWYLATSNILIFAKRQKHIGNEKGVGETTEDIFSINYPREIEKAIQSEDYRLAIRLMFLRLLRNLSNRHLIQYRPGRTNLEYLSQLSSTVHYNDFFGLTRNYEYAWYGKFDVSSEAFKTIRNNFENFDQQLK